MTKKPKTHVAIVLDRSGSMWNSRDKTVEGYNEWIQQLKEDAKTQDITCSLVSFNGSVFEHLWKVKAEDLEESNLDSYTPNGSTAFCDAVGYVIDKMMAEDDGDENTAYLLKCISDGEENASQHYRNKNKPEEEYAVIAEVFDGAKASKRWSFDFMGCSENDLKRINRYTGVDLSNMAVWSNASNQQTSRAFAENRQRTKQYFSSRAEGLTSPSNFHSSLDGVVASYTDDLVSSSGAIVGNPIIGTADVFTTSPQNCVVSDKNYKRPEWYS